MQNEKQIEFEQNLKADINEIDNQKLKQYAANHFYIIINEDGTFERFSHEWLHGYWINYKMNNLAWDGEKSIDEMLEEYKEEIIAGIIILNDIIIESYNVNMIN